MIFSPGCGEESGAIVRNRGVGLGEKVNAVKTELKTGRKAWALCECTGAHP